MARVHEATAPRSPLETWAKDQPDRLAIVMGQSGETLTYGELDERSNRVAQLLRSFGLRRGDGIVVMMENHLRYPEITWGAQRSGLYYTAINYHLAPDEVAYIVGDCGARVMFTTVAMATTVKRLAGQLGAIDHVLCVDGTLPDTEDYEDHLARQPATPVPDGAEGCELLYSSGTTGRPKAIKRPLPEGTGMVVTHGAATQLYAGRFGVSQASVYLSPAPLYHAAPLVTCMILQRLGATVVIMERFDAADALGLIEHHRVTHGQFVPTMFIRMLKLDTAERFRYDVSSLRCAIHAAAPCPVPVKHEMIEWWGPILHEYYAGTEGIGTTMIDSEEWLAHPGSVGRPLGCVVHIVADGQEVPTGETGAVYFESDMRFEYLNDPAKTASIEEGHGWRTLGDVGHLDEDGYLYLTDRASFMIVSGGVNIYPQEIEDLLVSHPAVDDVAVFGVPNDDFGEEVKAVVQPSATAGGRVDLDLELIEFCRAHVARYKCPRTIDMVSELPRDPNGKLYKRRLREQYWAGRSSRIL